MEIIIKKDEKLPTYEQLLEHYYFSIELWCIDEDPNDVDIDWVRANAFKLSQY